LPPAPHPFTHAPSAIAEQDQCDKVTAESPVPKAQKHIVHDPDAAQGITTLATGVGVIDRNMTVDVCVLPLIILLLSQLTMDLSAGRTQSKGRASLNHIWNTKR
jgi:hypothetical protein